MNGSTDGTIESRFFVHHDLKGSAVALTDSSGALVERYTYSEYGDPIMWWGTTWNPGTGAYSNQSSVSKVGLPYLYTGQRHDAESGLHYYKNRFYDPQNGRFLRRDLLGYADGPSLYQYAGGNPAMAVDPMGLKWLSAESWDFVHGYRRQHPHYNFLRRRARGEDH